MEPLNIYCQDSRSARNFVGVRLLSESWPGEIIWNHDWSFPKEGSCLFWTLTRGDNTEIMMHCYKEQMNFYHGDKAYFNRVGTVPDGEEYWRVTKNGLLANKMLERPDDRLKKLGLKKTQNWKPVRKHGYILICTGGKIENFYGQKGWEVKTIKELKKYTNRRIIVRAKPKGGGDDVPLDYHLDGAHAVITYVSGVAIEAAMKGIPVFTSPHSPAAPVACHDISMIEKPIYPDRRPWLNHLAYSQFTREELQNGYAWEILN